MSTKKEQTKKYKIIDDIPNEILFKYLENSVNLEVAREMACQIMNTLRQKQAALIEEKKKLEQLHYRVFSINNDLCRNVWKFSNKCDFPGAIHSYLNGEMTKHNTQLPRNSEFEQSIREAQTLSKDIGETQIKNVQEKYNIDSQPLTSGCEIPKDPKVQSHTQASKFSLKKPSIISKFYNKR